MATAVILGRREIRALPAEVAPARRWLSGLLAEKYAPVGDDVVLLACELVTNSLCHSDSAKRGKDGGPGTITLVVLDLDDRVRVEVTDAGSKTGVPRLVEDGPYALHGRGLHMLDAMSDRWGSHANGGGRTTWFEYSA